MISQFEDDFRDDYTEAPCLGLKSVLLKDRTCCYPKLEDQTNDNPSLKLKQLLETKQSIAILKQYYMSIQTDLGSVSN